MQANQSLRHSMERLVTYMDHHSVLHDAFWSSGIDSLAHETGLFEPTPAMLEIWRSAPGEATIHSMLLRQLETCQMICTSPEMAVQDKSAHLHAMNDVVVNTLLPRLSVA